MSVGILTYPDASLKLPSKKHVHFMHSKPNSSVDHSLLMLCVERVQMLR